jgi:hypothetical protein
LGEYFFCHLILLRGVLSRISESPVPPVDQFPGEKSKKVDSGDSSHIGPENGFQEAEIKLQNDQGEGRSKFERAKEYGE